MDYYSVQFNNIKLHRPEFNNEKYAITGADSIISQIAAMKGCFYATKRSYF